MILLDEKQRIVEIIFQYNMFQTWTCRNGKHKFRTFDYIFFQHQTQKTLSANSFEEFRNASTKDISLMN